MYVTWEYPNIYLLQSLSTAINAQVNYLEVKFICQGVKIYIYIYIYNFDWRKLNQSYHYTIFDFSYGLFLSPEKSINEQIRK